MKEICTYCEGTGELGFQRETCCFCDGTGFKDSTIEENGNKVDKADYKEKFKIK